MVRLAALVPALAVVVACNGSAPAPNPAPAPASSPEPEPEPKPELEPALAPEPLPAPAPASEGVRHANTSAISSFEIRDRLTDDGPRRELVFLTETGDVLASAMDLEAPDHLVFDYTKLMFVSLLLRPDQTEVLIIGLGGGSMIRFMRRYFPAIASTSVELDPAVVDAAKAWFGIVEGPKVALAVADGFDFLATTQARYDVIYMDAFIEASDATDASGAPRRMQTPDFMRDLSQRALSEGGLFVVNFHFQSELETHVRAIESVFRQVYVFNGGANVIVVGTMASERVDDETLRARGRELDGRADHGFSFEQLARTRTDEMF